MLFASIRLSLVFARDDSLSTCITKQRSPPRRNRYDPVYMVNALNNQQTRSNALIHTVLNTGLVCILLHLSVCRWAKYRTKNPLQHDKQPLHIRYIRWHRHLACES